MNIQPNISAIIFDYDGVLGDSTPFNTYACKAAAEKCGIKLEDDIYLLCAPGGATIKDIATCIMTHYGKPELIDDYLAYKKSYDKEYAKQVSLYEGVEEVIRQLSHKYKLAVNTGTRHVLVDSILAKHKVDKYFDVVIAAEDITKGKPDPESYLITCNKLGVEPSKTIVIEDGESGIVSAIKAGCHVIGLVNTINEEKLFSLGCNQVIKKLTELMAPSGA